MSAVSPLIIRLLLHYNHIAGAYDHPSPAAESDTDFLLKEGMIRKIEGSVEGLYKTTKRGDYYVEYLCNTPFPETHYKIVRTEDIDTDEEL